MAAETTSPTYDAKMTSPLTIALTYDLKSDYKQHGLSKEDLAEFDTEEGIAAIESALQKYGHTTIRVGNLSLLVAALANGEHKQWDLVFNMCEGMYGSAREAQVPALLEAYQIPFTFSDARVFSLVHDKAMTKTVLQQNGLPTAAFTTIAAKEPFSGWTASEWTSRLQGLQDKQSFPTLFLKPNQEGSSKGIYDFSKVSTPEEANASVMKLRTISPKQDILVEEWLDGREFTVSFLGGKGQAKVIGTLEIVWQSSSIGFWSCHMKNETSDGQGWTQRLVSSSDDPEVAQVENVALQAWKLIGCRDAGRVDVRCKGSGANAEPYIIEVRQPEHND